MYRIARMQDATSAIFQGSTQAVDVSLRDPSIRVEGGELVMLSDLGQGNSQYMIVKVLDTGSPPPPPNAPILVSDIAELAGRYLAEGNQLFVAWVKTVRYSLSHYAGHLDFPQGLTGTAYASVFERPRDYRLMLPINMQQDLPDVPGALGASFVNRIVGGTYEHEYPAQIRGPGSTLQDQTSTTSWPDYEEFPDAARVIASGGAHVGFWVDDDAPNGAIVGSDARVSSTVAAIFIVPKPAVGGGFPPYNGSVPPVPANVSPETIYGADSEDIMKANSLLEADVFSPGGTREDKTIFLGRRINPQFIGIDEQYNNAYGRFITVMK